MDIHNIYTIGRMCDADFLLKELHLRLYSSPFSWTTIDLKTALYFIENKFDDFTDTVKEDTYIHRNFTKSNGEPYNNNDERILHYSHHDMSDKRVISAMIRRGKRLLDDIYSPYTLLLHYDIAYRPIEYYTELLLPFTSKYGCNALVITQPENNIGPIEIIFNSERVSIISVGLNDKKNIHRVLKYLYSFQITPKSTYGMPL
jgi:hypothetical protein